MSNKQNKVNRNLLDTERQRSGEEYGQFNTAARDAYNTANTGQSNNPLRQSLIDRYSGSNNFLPPGMTPNSSGWFDMPPGMGSAGGDFGQAKTTYGNMAKTGGRENYAGAEESYKNFVNTGGLGEGEAQALRARATSQIPAFYQSYKDTLARRANTQGGYSPGFDAQTAEIGRQAGREGFNASRQIEGDIADKRIAGREFGTSGLAGIGRDVSGNQLAGAGGLTNIGGMEQQNNQFNAGQRNTMQQHLLDLYQHGGIESASGLKDVYGQDRVDTENAMRNWLAGMGGRSNAALQNINLRQNSSRGIDWARILGGAAGGARGLFGGGGSSSLPFTDDTYQGT